MFVAHIMDELPDEDPFTDIQKKTYFTPEEIVGNVVQLDIGGFHGRRIGRVIDVDEDGAVVTPMFLDEVHDAGDRLRFPKPGDEFTVHEVQRLEGEWVTEMQSVAPVSQVDRQLRDYDFEETYRVVERTYVHGAAEYQRLPIRIDDDEVSIPTEDSDNHANPEVLDRIRSAVDWSRINDNTFTIGEIFNDARTTEEDDDEIVWWNIDHKYRMDRMRCELQYPDRLLDY